MNIEDIAEKRSMKVSTIWSHFENLIEHGQIAVWRLLPKKKIVAILKKINSKLYDLIEEYKL